MGDNQHLVRWVVGLSFDLESLMGELLVDGLGEGVVSMKKPITRMLVGVHAYPTPPGKSKTRRG
jgi:hypothetical protein